MAKGHRPDNPDLQRVVNRIADLADDPRPRGSQKLTGREEYRLRQGAFRILCEVDDTAATVTARKIAQRREVYR